MLYLTCTTISSVDLAHYGVYHAKDWVSVNCGTTSYIVISYVKRTLAITTVFVTKDFALKSKLLF